MRVPQAGMRWPGSPLPPEPGSVFMSSARPFRGGCFPFLCGCPKSHLPGGGGQEEELASVSGGRRWGVGQICPLGRGLMGLGFYSGLFPHLPQPAMQLGCIPAGQGAPLLVRPFCFH